MRGLLERPHPHVAIATTHSGAANGGQTAGKGGQVAGPLRGGPDGRGRSFGGGPRPDERVRGERVALRLARLDRKLLDGVAGVDSATQRAVAIWLARRACAVVGLADLDWVKTALAALERGKSLQINPRRNQSRNDQQENALLTLWSAAEDPLSSALESLWYAIVTFGIEDRSLLSDVREAFPELVET